MILTYIFLFLFGLVVGSFLNVVIFRELEEEEKPKKKKKKLTDWLPAWFKGRSFCPHCHKTITWYDNIPLVSFFLLGGKCRFCRKKIDLQYPLVELLTAFEFVWVYWLLQHFSFFGRLEGFYSFALLAYWIFIFSALLAIFVADLRGGIIPDWVVIPAIIVSILRLFESGRWSFLLTGLAAAFFFFSLFWITKKKGIGFGDVKLALLIGIFLGFPATLVAIFLAFLTGALVAVILMLLGKKRFGQTIAFGPFLVVGTIVAKFWGEALWQWYFSLLF